ncbi:hypothetical protein FISHEDRAFT_64107 [Fistulina hepatica ATCC 64428]|uniref:ThuA-like domain-containing protein n=1 Tax=Fistulina hepatica ATCC 64428 TaxID=1128425 RepID=A0A0D7AJR3_9AGAR|nr:hypothetical protein FISHEDRAFT_64107 [Fistulina hepatica ATCC 64428]
MNYWTKFFTLFANLLSLAIWPGVMAGSSARVLIYSATVDFRHDSIPTAIQALKIEAPLDQVNDNTLARYDALLFLMNTGEVLNNTGKAALQNYLDVGGNFIAVHAAADADALRNTTFYGRELDAYFDYHPALQNATVDVIDASNPSGRYNFKLDPHDVGAVVVLSANESSYVDTGTHMDQGNPHPIAWYQEHGAGIEGGGTAGRSFYTNLGHLNESWMDDTFMAHVLGGVKRVLLSNRTKVHNSSALAIGNGNSSTSVTSLLPTSSSSTSVPSVIHPSNDV